VLKNDLIEMEHSTKMVNGLEVIIIENECIRCEIVPESGGKIISVFNKTLNREFLWSNQHLELKKHNAGDAYDPNFWGGIDELLPNDIPENIDGTDFPDHGELWTTALQYVNTETGLKLFGLLPMSGLYYEKSISLETGHPKINLQYSITNRSTIKRHFMWKLHAALFISGGDRVVSGARKAHVADLQYSRFKSQSIFEWPDIENTDASVIPAVNGEMDFFYLYDIDKGEMQLRYNTDKSVFAIEYDIAVFPYQWLFSSYGGFDGHYTAVLEPCSTMPISVNDAIKSGQCSVLEPGEKIETSVGIYAGEKY
jgi:hypothetical protein